MTGTRAISHAVSGAGGVTTATAGGDGATIRPTTTNATRAKTVTVVSEFWSTRPGLTPRTWTSASITMIPIATRARVDSTTPIGPIPQRAITEAFPAPGTKRSR